MLRTRLWMGALLIFAFAASLGLDEWLSAYPAVPPYPCWFIVSVLAMIGCCRELRQLLRRRGIRTSRLVSYGSLILIVCANWVPWLNEELGVGDRLAWPLAAACVANMVVLMREAAVYREPGQAVLTAGGGLLIVFYLGVLGTFAIQLRWLQHGLLALTAYIAAAKFGDIGAYFGGRAFGRHKLSPHLSPNKTVEGALAGAMTSVLGTSAVVLLWQRITGAVPPLSWSDVALFGLLVGAVAQVGDLIESMIKRDCQQKDASDIVPGFGGVLDVLDSPLFSAPLAFALWVSLGPGWGAGIYLPSQPPVGKLERGASESPAPPHAWVCPAGCALRPA